MGPTFRSIQFGYASAEVESAESPHLLLDAFLDPEGIIHELVDGRRFIVLGTKGAGKSAVGLHLCLEAEGNPNRFVSTQFLADLSYKSLSGLVRAEVEPELRFPRAWSFVILLMLLNSMAQDEGADHEDPARFRSAVSAFRDAGLIPTDDLARVVGTAHLNKFELSAFNVKLTGSADSQDPEVLLTAVTTSIKELLSASRSSSRHTLILDGLDDVLLADNIQLQALSGLILETSRLNAYFRQRDLPLKILVLCRTDIYERIPGPNQNKIRQDLAVELQWFEESGAPHRSKLVRLANLRAQHAGLDNADVITQFLPAKMGTQPTIKMLLDHTRHTPRDFLQLLKYLQQAADQEPLDHYHVRAGLRTYAEHYFLPEVRDELDGTVSAEELNRVLGGLRQFPKIEFRYEDLEDHFRRMRIANVDLDRVLVALYGCSALGNVYTTNDGWKRFTFRYRSPASAFARDQNMMLHNAVRRAMGFAVRG